MYVFISLFTSGLSAYHDDDIHNMILYRYRWYSQPAQQGLNPQLLDTHQWHNWTRSLCSTSEQLVYCSWSYLIIIYKVRNSLLYTESYNLPLLSALLLFHQSYILLSFLPLSVYCVGIVSSPGQGTIVPPSSTYQDCAGLQSQRQFKWFKRNVTQKFDINEIKTMAN